MQDGATNMAIDEAILEAVAAGDSPPTLRFYGWKPACLSLGYAQQAAVADWEACAAFGWDVVRRPTGGRAILHVDELTYSVCAPEGEPRVAGTVLESYRRLSDALAEGLELMGLKPARARADGAGESGPACFDGPANYEITIAGRKLVGSAQARRLGVVLQHGSLPLTGDIGRISRALAVEGEEARTAIARGLARQAITLENSLGREISFAEAARFLADGFRRALNLELAPDELTVREWERARAIRAEKYGNRAWTRRL